MKCTFIGACSDRTWPMYFARLKRVAQFYGASPQFILTSATIANPMDLAERLIEEPVMLVNNDGAAKGPRHFLIYNPPVVNEAFGLRQSVLQESIQLTRALLDHDVQAIVFGRARRTVELLLRYLREKEPVAPGAGRLLQLEVGVDGEHGLE